MSKITIFNSWDYLDNPDDGYEAWQFEKNMLLDYFRRQPTEGQVIMQGTVGRWNGTFPAGKAGIIDLLLSKLLESADDVEIFDDNGHLFIRTLHHDGANVFEVKILTCAGLRALEAYNDGHGRWQDISEKELHDKLMHNSRYTHLPYYAKHIGLKAAQTA